MTKIETIPRFDVSNNICFLGQKDVISIGKKQYKQNRLLIIIIKELYLQFLMKNQNQNEVRFPISLC